MNKKYTQAYKDAFIPTYAPLEAVFEKGTGAYLFDVDGKKYLDFAAGVAVSSMGHSNPILLKALHKQIDEVLHTSNIFMNKSAIELASLFKEKTFADKVFLCSSGLEANEAALKLARFYAFKKFGEQKNKIISFTNSFHGRSLFTVSVGGQPKYSQGFGDLPKDIVHAEFNNLDSVKKLIDENTCAIIVEPIQGEGGVIPATKEFLQGLRNLCDEFSVALIFDEVQTGIGRCGWLYAYEAYKVTPDLLTSAKGLGAGIAIGALLAKDEFASVFTAGTHGSTYGGNPLASAAGVVSLNYFSDPTNLYAIREKSDFIFQKLKNIQKKYSNLIFEIRGMGLLIGLDLNPEYKNAAEILQNKNFENGLLVLRAGTNTLRLAPPLTVNENDINSALQILQNSIEQTLEILESQ